MPATSKAGSFRSGSSKQSGAKPTGELLAKGIAAFGVWISNTFRGQSRDFNNLLGLIIGIVTFGLVMVLSASYVTSQADGENAFAVFNKQFFWAVVGLVAMGIISRISVSFIQRATPFYFLFVLGLQLLVLVIGTEIYGNKNWIRIGDLSVQPSEFLKIGLLLLLSMLLVQRRDYFDSFKLGWGPALVAAGAATGSVILGSDLGTSIVMFGFAFVTMILAGMPAKFIGWILAASSVAALFFLNTGSRRTRISAWLNPDAVDITGATWQAKHGIWALAAGGIGGTGLGDSKMKWNWIPMVENDYIFSVVGEEWGLLGASALILMFVLLSFALIRILNRTDRLFERYVMIGIVSWITIQSFINIGVVLNFLPVLGVPLPLISAGGTSLLATLATLGLALGIERRNSAADRAPVARRVSSAARG
jgi:cell division protein FtsW